MTRLGFRVVVSTLLLILIAIIPLVSGEATADESQGINPHFPRPPSLSPNVTFWKRVFTEFGVGDFILHDRDNLAIIYEVAHVGETTNERRAADAAKPEIQRLRAKYEGILTQLAQGATLEGLGPEAASVARAWGCPCAPEQLRRAASNIRVQQGIREKVDEALPRAQRLMPKILPILQRHDVPHELAALPLVESAFNPHAQSKAGAVGLWQFIKSTGKQYMSITRHRDDRRDPIRATDAAARLLKDNYQALGTWPLAIIAYNHGKEGILTAKAAVGSSAVEDIIARHTGPRFGFASKNFYPEFLAALEIVHPVILAHREQSQDSKRKSRGAREG